MRCDEVLDLLMEADLEVLSDRGDGELSRHLEQCSSCRTEVARMIEVQVRLEQGIEDLRPRTPLNEALARAKRRARRRAVGRWWPVPVLTAAALAFVLLRPGRPAGPVPTAQAEEDPSARYSLEVDAPGKNFTVWNIDSPDVVVVWFF
jgi:anti-sigma factor RsiW